MGQTQGGSAGNLELLEKIKEQQAEIEELKQRTAVLEAGNEKALQYINNGPWGFNSFRELTSSDDLNDCTDFGVLYSWGGDFRPVNSPMDRCTMYNIKSYWGIMQIAIRHSLPVLYIRVRFANNFSDWKEI